MKVRQIAEGRPGAYQVAAEVRKAVQRGAVHLLVIAQAQELVRGLAARDKVKEAQAIYNFANRAIRYTDDPLGNDNYSYVDTLVHPPEVIEDYINSGGLPVAGDCVTQSALVVSLAKALRIPARIKIIGDEGGFFHVFPELLINGQWVAADVTATTATNEAIRKAARLGFKVDTGRELTFGM